MDLIHNDMTIGIFLYFIIFCAWFFKNSRVT